MRAGFFVTWLSTITLFALVCQAQPPRGTNRNGARSSRDTMFRLLDMQPVRREIGLRSLQIDMLEDLQADLFEQRRAAYSSGSPSPGGGPRGPAASDQAARDRFNAMRAAVEKIRTQGEQLIAVILDGDQTKRLHELRLQDEGVRALDRQELRDQLNVTAEQAEQIQQLRRRGDDPTVSRNRRQKELEASVMALLTTEQRAQFKEMQGEPFDFPLAVPADLLRGLRGPQEGSRPRRPSN